MFCPRCFENIPDTSQECPACGTSLRGRSIPASPKPRLPNRPGPAPSSSFSLSDRIRASQPEEPERPRSHLSLAARLRRAKAPETPLRLDAPNPAPRALPEENRTEAALPSVNPFATPAFPEAPIVIPKTPDQPLPVVNPFSTPPSPVLPYISVNPSEPPPAAPAPPNAAPQPPVLPGPSPRILSPAAPVPALAPVVAPPVASAPEAAEVEILDEDALIEEEAPRATPVAAPAPTTLATLMDLPVAAGAASNSRSAQISLSDLLAQADEQLDFHLREQPGASEPEPEPAPGPRRPGASPSGELTLPAPDSPLPSSPLSVPVLPTASPLPAPENPLPSPALPVAPAPAHAAAPPGAVVVHPAPPSLAPPTPSPLVENTPRPLVRPSAFPSALDILAEIDDEDGALDDSEELSAPSSASPAALSAETPALVPPRVPPSEKPADSVPVAPSFAPVESAAPSPAPVEFAAPVVAPAPVLSAPTAALAPEDAPTVAPPPVLAPASSLPPLAPGNPVAKGPAVPLGPPPKPSGLTPLAQSAAKLPAVGAPPVAKSPASDLRARLGLPSPKTTTPGVPPVSGPASPVRKPEASTGEAASTREAPAIAPQEAAPVVPEFASGAAPVARPKTSPSGSIGAGAAPSAPPVAAMPARPKTSPSGSQPPALPVASPAPTMVPPRPKTSPSGSQSPVAPVVATARPKTSPSGSQSPAVPSVGGRPQSSPSAALSPVLPPAGRVVPPGVSQQALPSVGASRPGPVRPGHAPSESLRSAYAPPQKVVPAARTTPDAAAPELPLPVVPVESEATVDISPAELAALLGTPEVNPNALTATSFPALRDPGDLEPPITPTVLAPPAPVSRTLPEADDLGEDSATVALLRGFPGEPPSGPVSSGLLLAELFARQSSSSSRPITEEVLLTEDALTAIAEMAPSRNKRPLPTVLLSAPPDLPPPPSPATPRPATPPPATPRPATPVLLPPAAPEEIEAPTRRNPSLAQVARAAAEDPATKRTPALRAASQVIETATIPAPELSAQFEETLAVSEASDSFEETSESSQLTPPSASPPVEIEEFEEVYEEAGPEWAGFQSADELMAALPGYFQAGRFVDAFEQIDRLSEWEPSPISRARRYYAIALDLFQNYQQTDPALELLNEALDADPMFLESFEKIDQVLTRQRDWARLAENYRRMLGRVPVLRNDLRLMLWHALGEIYRSRLGDFSSAIGAFEEAQRIDPENPIRRQILEELYEREPSRWESAAEAHRARLQEGVTAYELRALLRVFQRAGQPQGAFWAASALRALGQATPDEEALAVQGRFSFGAGFSGESLFHSLPYALPHEDGSALVSELFGLAVPALSGLFGRSERDLGLQNARRIPPGAALPLARLIESQADALGVPRPAIFFAGPAGHDDPPDTGISILPLLGESVGVLVSPLVQQLQREKDLVFMVTRHLFYLRPEHLLIRFGAVNQPLLRVWVRALTSLVAPALVAPREGDDEALSWSRRLAPLLAPALVEQLRDVVTRAVQRGKDPSTTAWFSYVERSANRAALLACGDLESAARVLQTDTSPLSILSARAKLHDLLRFAVSAEHAALRAKG